MIGAVVAPQREAGSICEQLTRLGLAPGQVVLCGEPAVALRGLADILARAQDDVLVVPGGLVVHDEALGDLVLDPRDRSAALLARDGASPTVRVQAGRVVDAGSGVHRAGAPDRAFTGAVRVRRADAAAAAQAARAMAEVAAAQGWVVDPVDLLLVALVRTGMAVGEVTLDPWPWQRDGDAADLRERLAGVDVVRLRLARATNSDDDLWATLVARPLSRRLTPLAIRAGATPNQVTALSFLVALVASACFAGIRLGGAAGLLFGLSGALLLQASFVLDCVDGEIARYRRAFSPLGAWLDASTDRLKEFVSYAGLALGAGGTSAAWLLAAGALTLLSVRHATDDSFTAIMAVREAPTEDIPMDRPDGQPGPANASRAVQASQRSNARRTVHWAKRVAHLPIGERWLLMSVGAALARPLWALAALLGLGLLSLAYTVAGRSLRALGWPHRPTAPREHEVVVAQLDPGPVAWALSRVLPGGARQRRSLSGRFLWLLPPAVRLAEYAAVLLLARVVTGAATAAAFAMLLCVAYHHYDALYGVLQRLPPSPEGIRLAGLGVEGRVLLVASLALAGATWLHAGLWVTAAVLGVLFLGYGSLRVWRETS